MHDARDFLRLVELVDMKEVEGAWQEHRKTDSPDSFAEAARRLHYLIATFGFAR